ncbi:hypothetical protein LTR10_019049 [Elasticomyces elasticus]|nr:hypothetical protein LTR10_019049 [Elasticomyces elasticus]
MTPKAAVPRKKTCNTCSKAKASPTAAQDECDTIGGSTSVLAQTQYAAIPSVLGTALTSPASAEIINFENVQLVRTVDDYRIRARWLESVLPSAHQTPKQFAPSTMAFVSEVFKSYPGMFMAENAHPPFIHWAQVASKLHFSLLATLQAYLLLTIMLFFTSRSGTNFIEQDIMIKLQELAGDVASKGTLCLAETNGARPDWESWIIASATRRTLFATYLFDNLVNFTLGSPSFIATELASLPAPASQRLWSAQTRHLWNTAYNQQLSQCADGGLLISHLWPSPDSDTPKLKKKVRQWLSSVDEFGMMLYAVTSHTYGKQA